MKEIQVNSETVKVVREFDIYQYACECDSIGYLVRKDDGKLALVMTNHGHFYFASTSELLDFVRVYQEAIQNMLEIVVEIKGEQG